MKDFIILIGSMFLVFALFLLQSFVLASITSFLLGFIGIHEIMNYETTYFLFFIFLILGIIASYFKKSESK